MASLTPERVRDLVIECLLSTQRDVFERQRKSLGLPADEDALLKSVTGAVRLAFRKTGGDFDHPDRLSLMNALESLQRTVSTWGTDPAVLENNRAQVLKLLQRLQ